MPITLDGTNGITTPMYNGSITANAVTPSVNMKNRIINGAMVIDQRNAGAATANTISGYTLDRWIVGQTVTGKLIAQQNAGSVTPPAGFSNYLGITSQSAYSVGSGDLYYIQQAIEGFNTSDLNFGSANAKTVTISFWVRSSLTGNFGGSLYNNAVNRLYPFSYTISVANTWEQKTVTIAGDTSGTWVGATNGAGAWLLFSVGAGSGMVGTANAWANGSGGSGPYAPTGSTSVVGTNGATFYITGVQLEVGSTATSFDYRPYGTELQLCQRYLPAVRATASTYEILGTIASYGGTALRGVFQFQVPTRVPPSGVTSSAASTFSTNIADVNYTPTAITLTSVVGTTGALVEFTRSSPPTAGYAGFFNFTNAGTGYIYFTGCEL
jgi:hypothetical protein